MSDKNTAVIQRTPSIRVVIMKWATRGTPSINEYKAYNSNQLENYSYGETLDNMSPPFSLAMHLSTYGVKDYLYRELEPHDIVEFRDHNNNLLYAGLIQSINTNWSVAGNESNAEMQTQFIVTGTAVTSIFDMPLDLSLAKLGIAANAIYQNIYAILESFNATAASNTPLSSLYTTLKDAWFKLYAGMCGISEPENSPIAMLYQTYCKAAIFGSFAIPKLITMPQGQITLSQFLRQIANHPFGMLYARMEGGKYAIRIDDRPLVLEPPKGRPTNNWYHLPQTGVNGSHLLSLNLHRTMKDVITATNLVIPEFIGGSITSQYLATTTQNNGPVNRQLLFNGPAMQRYGFRLFEAEIRYFDFNAEGDWLEDVNTAAQELYSMYEHSADFYSGNVNIAEDYKPHKIGQKIGIESIYGLKVNPNNKHDQRAHPAQFYLEAITHSGGYGIPPTASLQVTRGAIYKYGTGEFLQGIYDNGANSAALRGVKRV